MRLAFPEFRIHVEEGDTVLTGVLADQASVYGVLAAMESLGLELLEMRRVMPDQTLAAGHSYLPSRRSAVSS